ncbi:sensor domain-containing diguanylate cyclase [Bordetella bronchiseptica]|uniref:sensor domain-containing diguanylate cyclase n=1 Tax=Bordetella bronchiseptica TaxID=518 RepID=UPI000460CDDB|nr:sensor domain-containing diguanylate cyclase [Bordetella bronchiseptica]AWP75184.1 sensor domain-containing diguanylate cyclase [Bordetella bronchiseptica]AZW12697.1 sensor domain-containing diguanylate cyclase [Bordetella bronchiseptica]KDB91786.1 diguanylate cyclase (GGDEF) domain protein [Bordetella bronchiseptica D993]KDB99098.1 diguanylate cyclase (GGDEF) domain protein [Bordetella bronchiseptica E010]KDC65981.1 diguanylate cyclase (GGDEF) domain protein [Bordetella bronchiseptica MBOR
MPDASTLFNDSAVYRTLLESTKAIPWKIDWATMKFTYIGPQIEALLGWSADSWVSVEDWAMRMHPEDREYVVNYCVSQSQAGQDHEADYRALTKDNGYVWIRDVVHVVRNDKGEAEALIGFMFDITERKKTEEKLLLLQKELEVLSFKDGLTNIANRRRFDSSFDLEWERARHERQPLSMLLFDVDYFKQYNDLYGHTQGDECLVEIAQTLSLALDGPRDLVARYGGEEFVVLLPEADAEVARKVAERCQRLIEKKSIVHALSPHGRRVTVSIGAGTVVPGEQTAPAGFIKAVDQQLYAAKKNGRHRIEHVRLET